MRAVQRMSVFMRNPKPPMQASGGAGILRPCIALPPDLSAAWFEAAGFAHALPMASCTRRKMQGGLCPRPAEAPPRSEDSVLTRLPPGYGFPAIRIFLIHHPGTPPGLSAFASCTFSGGGRQRGWWGERRGGKKTTQGRGSSERRHRAALAPSRRACSIRPSQVAIGDT